MVASFFGSCVCRLGRCPFILRRMCVFLWCCCTVGIHFPWLVWNEWGPYARAPCVAAMHPPHLLSLSLGRMAHQVLVGWSTRSLSPSLPWRRNSLLLDPPVVRLVAPDLDSDSTNERTRRKRSMPSKKDLDERAPCHRDLAVQIDEDSIVGASNRCIRSAGARSGGDVRGHGDVHGARDGMQDVQERGGRREEDRRQP